MLWVPDYWTISRADLVKSSAKILDQVTPDWAKKINFDTLEMMTANRCIIGQIYDLPEGPTGCRMFCVRINVLKEHGYKGGGAFADPKMIPFWQQEVANRCGHTS